MPRLSRRTVLGAAAATTLLGIRAAPARDQAALSLGLGFSLYGARSLTPHAAAALCAEIGYDCVELPVMKGWPGDSETFRDAQRREFRLVLKQHDLKLSAIMENLPIFGDDAAHQANLRRLQLAGEVAHAVSDEELPVMETILGGKPSQWPEVQDLMAKRLADWAAAAEKAKLVVAIKAHVGGAMHLPQHPAQLVKQVDSPWIRAAYDFSHFRLQEVDMATSVRQLAPVSVFVHVKDAAGDASKVKFLLPGQGDINYAQLFLALVRNGYRGDIVVEVSGQIHGKTGYNCEAAARSSYPVLARAMAEAGISRRRR